MLQNYCAILLLFCLGAVHGMQRRVQSVPVSPVGPFDEREDTNYTSPSGQLKHAGMFEGDIKYSGRGLFGTAGSLNPWPNAVIPYRFDCSVENIPSAIEATKAAMKVWEANTCIRFVKKRPEDKAFLELFRAAGCWATYVGYRKDTKTQISIGSGCDYKHVMEHELGHVIGFWHEQSRKDRDKFIQIEYGNVIAALKYNFDKVRSATSNYGHAYDYGSIMHYPWNAFALNRNLRTIRPIKPLNGKTPYIGLSNVDAAQANRMYKCRTVQRVRGVEVKQIDAMKLAMSLVGRSRSVGFKCADARSSCKVWADHGHCRLAANPLLIRCPKSCGNCGPCKDLNFNCAAWKKKGYCSTRPEIMLRHCKVSCGVCIPVPCGNKQRNCKRWAKQRYCERRPVYMRKNCKKACGVCKSATKKTVAPTRPTQAPTRPTQAPCKDKHRRCKAYVDLKYCVATYTKFMKKNCKKSCNLCGKKPATTKAPRPQTKATTKKPAPTMTTASIAVTVPKTKFTGIKCEDRSTNCKDWQQTRRCITDRWVMDNCLLSCKRFNICDPKPIKPVGACTSPLGVGWNGATNNAKHLRRANFYGTSLFSPGGGWVARAHGGRLYVQDNHSLKEVGAWCAHPRNTNSQQYLQIDLGEMKTITAVATQGRDRYFEHVKSYSLSFSRQRTRGWREYQEHGKKKIFEGNCDHFTPVMNLLRSKAVARYIRFHPIRFIGAMCMRVEVYGCRKY